MGVYQEKEKTMNNSVYTKQVLGLDEYLIGIDEEELMSLSGYPAIASAIKTLYTLRGSKVDLGEPYIDSLPWAEGEEVFFDDEKV